MKQRRHSMELSEILTGVVRKTAYIYARYSSDQQREESIDAQLRACREYCLKNDIRVIHEFVDEAKSATSDKRPAFQAMFKDLRDIDFIIVHKLDRFSRDRYDTAYYQRVLKKAGARLISVLEPLDDSPESIIMESMLAGMAEYYSKNLARETMKGLKETAYQCKHTGGATLYGYKVNEDHTYRIDPLEADVVKKVFRMYVDGYRYEDIVNAVEPEKKLAKSAINSMLSNERYNGVYVFGRQTRAEKNSHNLKPAGEQVRIPGGMPQIIDDNTWARAQARLHDRKHNASGRAVYPFLFQGKIECACGRIMSCGSSTGKGHIYGYYRCPDKCGTKPIRADKFDKAFLNAFSRAIDINDLTVARILVRVKKQEEPKKSPYADELKRVRKEIKSLVEAMKAGAHHQMIIDQLNELSEKERQLQAREPVQQKMPTSEDVYRFLEDMKSIQDKPYEEQRAIIHALVDRVIINKTGQITVRFCLPMVAGGRNCLFTLPLGTILNLVS